MKSEFEKHLSRKGITVAGPGGFVESLRQLLAEAEKGEITGLVAAMTNDDSQSKPTYLITGTAAKDITTTIAAISRMQKTFLELDELTLD